MKPTPTTVAVLVCLGLSAAVLSLQAPTLSEPGMYYDEAFLAQQARDFLEPERITQHPPGTSSTWILGRPFPLRNASYLGSLKSQLLIPSLAVFGSSPTVVRVTTLCTALAALLFLTLWAQRVVGTPIALVAAPLVAFDPSFVFFGTYEWGPYTTLLLCRGVGLYCVTAGWQERRHWQLVFGGLVLGLGVYARVDFALILACMGAGGLAACGRSLISQLRSRRRVALLAVSALLVGASPAMVSITGILKASTAVSNRGGLPYRWDVLWSTLDGSHFYRVMDAGGLFDRLFQGGAPWDLLAAATALSLPILGWLLFVKPRRAPEGHSEAPQNTGLRFLLLTFVGLAVAMLMLPGAVRAHHMLNVLPLPHLLIAGTLVSVAAHRATHVVAVTIFLALLASQFHVLARTHQLIRDTGGRGRWSSAIEQLAEELDAAPQDTAVALDWGFHEPLLFLTTSRRLEEAIWEIPRMLRQRRPWVHEGDESHRYLVHDAPYDLFQLGPKFLAAVREIDPELVEIRTYSDREGVPAFYTVRFARPHQLIYSGVFRVLFR